MDKSPLNVDYEMTKQSLKNLSTLSTAYHHQHVFSLLFNKEKRDYNINLNAWKSGGRWITGREDTKKGYARSGISFSENVPPRRIELLSKV